MGISKNIIKKKANDVFAEIGLMIAALLVSSISIAQVATINITNINTNVMSNTKLLFGITFDSRTSLIGNSTYGQIGYYDASGVVIPQVDALFNNFPMSTIRYPGNGIAVGFNWKKSIDTIGMTGPRPNQNLLGGLGAPQPVNFGFDEFMAMAAAKGMPASEVQIMVPIYDVSTPGLTPTQAAAALPNVINLNADWVEYCNAPNDGSNPGGGKDWAAERAANGHPAPYGIKIWNIGNEPWSGLEFGPSNINCNSYLTSVTPIINAMLAIDPTLKITMPTTGNATSTLSWSYALLNSSLVSSGKVFALSQHFFGDEHLSTSGPGVNASSIFLDNLISASAIKGVKVFVGDYAHSIFTPNPTIAQQDSAMQWLGANYEADFLLMLSQKSTIERANFWAYGNAYAAWHPIRINFTGDYTLMPAAAIYKILFPAFLDNSVQVSTSSPSASDGNPYAIRSNAFVSNDMNYLNVVSVNRDKNNSVPLQVGGVVGYTLSNARILTATNLNSEIIVESTATTNISGDYIMPPMSVLILEYINPSVGISEAVINNKNITIYPNPSTGLLTFSEPLNSVVIYNNYGQIVLVKKEPTKNISTEGLQNGSYIIISNKGVFKFIVAN